MQSRASRTPIVPRAVVQEEPDATVQLGSTDRHRRPRERCFPAPRLDENLGLNAFTFFPDFGGGRYTAYVCQPLDDGYENLLHRMRAAISPCVTDEFFTLGSGTPSSRSWREIRGLRLFRSPRVRNHRRREVSGMACEDILRRCFVID